MFTHSQIIDGQKFHLTRAMETFIAQFNIDAPKILNHATHTTRSRSSMDRALVSEAGNLGSNPNGSTISPRENALLGKKSRCEADFKPKNEKKLLTIRL